MTGFLNNSEIEITCTKCNRKTKKSIRWIKNNSKFTCACGTIISLNASQFKRKIAVNESALRKLRDSLKKFNK